MSLNYIFTSKLKEIAKNKRMAFIIVICLVLGYAFILIFSSKLYGINRRIALAQMKHVENAWISTHFDEIKLFSSPQVKAGIEHRTDFLNTSVYFTFKNETFKAFAIETNKEFAWHYNLEGFSEETFDPEFSRNRIMISEHLANKYHIHVGDELLIDGELRTVCSINACEYFQNMIIFPENSGIKYRDGYVSRKSIIQFKASFLKEHPEIVRILSSSKFTPLEKEEKKPEGYFGVYLLSVIRYALIFIVISILNCYLVFYSNISYRRKTYGIKKTYGASSSTCFRDIFLENAIFSFLAFHIACFLLHVFRYNIPVFFYTEMTVPLYGIGMCVAFFFTLLYSLLTFRKINKLSTIRLLKE